MAKKSTSFRIPHSLRVSIAGLIFMLSLIPMTMYAVENQQDIRQHASPLSFESVTADYNYDACPAAVPFTPGWWNPKSISSGVSCKDDPTKNPGTVCGDSSDHEIDPAFWFGKVFDSTDPSDPLYTAGQANVEARWAGYDGRHIANPGDRGDGYSAFQWFDGVQRAGGWYYESSKDKAGFGVGVYQCDGSIGNYTNCGRNGWSYVMGLASKNEKIQLDKKGVLPDRRCILAKAVVQAQQDWVHGKFAPDAKSSDVGFYSPNANPGPDVNPGTNPTIEPSPTPTAIPVKAVQVSAPKGSILAAIGIAGVVLAGLALFGGW